jgi:hypothetical protein
MRNFPKLEKKIGKTGSSEKVAHPALYPIIFVIAAALP